MISSHEFGLYSESSHIINGHTPVRTSKGRTPVREVMGNCRFVIDGGFCKSYHKDDWNSRIYVNI